MIHVDNTTTQITGELDDVLADLTSLLRIVYKQLVNIFGEKKAGIIFVQMGKMAVMTDKEIDNLEGNIGDLLNHEN